MVKKIILSLIVSSLLVPYGLAEESVPAPKAKLGTTQLIDYEKQVREVAQRTADEARAKKAQERLDRARTSSLNLVPSANTAKINASSATDSTAEKAALASAPSPVVGSAPSPKPNTFTNIPKSTAGDAGSLRVFKYRKGGATVFADSAPYKTHYEVVIYNSCYACSLTSNVNWYNTRLRFTEFAEAITSAARQYGVNPGFVRAIIHAESAFNPLARSRKGAMGLMQLMPGTAKDMGVVDLTDPEQNIKGGVRYLAGLLQTFNGSESLAAAAYNAGPGAVARYGGIPPYEETQTYVKRVNILANRYKNQPQLAVNK